MKFNFLTLIIISILLLGCKNKDEEALKKPTLDNITDCFANKDSLSDIEMSPLIDYNGKSNSKLIDNEKLKEKKEALIERKKEVIKEKNAKSKLKNIDDCQQVIAKYREVLKQFEKTKDIKLLKWKDNNDPIYHFCYEKYKTEFDSLERIENAIGLKLGF